MVKRTDKQLEKTKILEKLDVYGLKKENIEHLTTDKLRRTLHTIRKEMKTISTENVRIVIVAPSNNDYDSDCSYCDTDDSECEYCDSEDTEISIESKYDVSEVSDSE